MDLDKLFERLTSYDLFSRLLAGAIAAFSIDYFDIFTWYSGAQEKPPVWAILLVVYFVGIVLEELLWLMRDPINNVLDRLPCIAKEEGSDSDNDTSSYRKQADKLALDGHGSLIDNAQVHYVMSGSLGIAFLLMAIAQLLKLLATLISKWFSIDMPAVVTQWFPILKPVILAGLAALFFLRYRHYRLRRRDLAQRYYKAAYMDKEESKTA